MKIFICNSLIGVDKPDALQTLTLCEVVQKLIIFFVLWVSWDDVMCQWITSERLIGCIIFMRAVSGLSFSLSTKKDILLNLILPEEFGWN